MKILTLCGGIARNSINKKLLELIKPLAPKDFEFTGFDVSSLPHYSQDIETPPPASVAALKEAIAAAQGVLFMCPEYNRSVPGVLKNAVDWASRPWGENAWAGKSAAVLGASPGVIGAFGAQMHLKRTLSFLNMRVMYQPEVYCNFTHSVNEAGELAPAARGIFENFLAAFREWILRQG
jgi:chromate reductase